MKIPYNQVHANGNILFAARGGKILSFSLLYGCHLSTWKHPGVDKVADAVKAIALNEAENATAHQLEGAQKEDQDHGRPAKRQRTEDSQDVSDAAANGEQTTGTPAQETEQGSETKAADEENGKAKKQKQKQKQKRGNGEAKNTFSRVPDRPVITHLKSTDDGKHVLAVSGHDKTIWVFDHDGRGVLTEISQRTMPKRPSSVVIGPDSHIICADKFGDVYALPLITSDDAQLQQHSSFPLRSATRSAFKLSADTTTVHSQRNLKALRDQQRQVEEQARAKTDEQTREDAVGFDLSLLLGHVSMLTDVVLAESHGGARRYILTGDRDEHIRVSRYIPHAHVIEGYCLGHKEFVGALVVPSGRPDILVSGGGDADLFTWDWTNGKLLSQTNVLSLAQKIAPETTTKVAVSGLYSLRCPSQHGTLTFVLAICESIKAIFSWQLTNDNVLNHPGITQLPGNPLHLAVATPPQDADTTSMPKIIVAVDPGEPAAAKSMHVFTLALNEGRLSVETDETVKDDAEEAEELDVSETDVRGLLYNVESMRKLASTGDEVEGEDGGDAEAKAQAEGEGPDAAMMGEEPVPQS